MGAFGRVVNPGAKLWLRPDVMPIIACMGIAIGWTGYKSFRAMFMSPDVSIDKARRQAAVKSEYLAEEAREWRDNRKMWLVEDVSKVRIF